MAKDEAPKLPRKSRNGCVSCRRMRIKCDEAKPTCEYCEATNKVCQYVAPPPPKPRKRQKAAQAESVAVTKRARVEPLQVPEVSVVDDDVEYIFSSKDNSRGDESTWGSYSATPDDGTYDSSTSSLEIWTHEVCTPDFSDPYNSLSPLARLTASEIHCLEFFILHGCGICSLGEPTVARMWVRDGVKVALGSDSVLNGIVALSTLLMDRNRLTSGPGPESLNHYTRAVRLLRDIIASDRRTHRPPELLLSSILVFVFAFTESRMTPVMSRAGQLDLFGLIRGIDAIFVNYAKDIADSFLIKLTLPHHRDTKEELRAKYKVTFVDKLEAKLAEYEAADMFADDLEVRVYEAALGGIGYACRFSRKLRNLYPMMSAMSSLPPKFVDYLREDRPFALVIQSYLCALYRRVVFYHRPQRDTWDDTIDECIARSRNSDMRQLCEEARLMRRGLMYGNDIDMLLALSPLQLYASYRKQLVVKAPVSEELIDAATRTFQESVGVVIVDN